MADSKNVIARMMFSHLGGTARVENIDTEQTSEAIQAKLWYDEARRMTLADHDWTFARKRIALAASSQDPPNEWSYSYQAPADMVAARRIVNPVGPDEDDPPYSIEAGPDDTEVILTDVEQAILVYTRNVKVTGLFGPHFTIALSYIWAHFVAAPATGKRNKKTDMLGYYREAIDRASARDANQETNRAPREASSIRARS